MYHGVLFTGVPQNGANHICFSINPRYQEPSTDVIDPYKQVKYFCPLELLFLN